jgi:hypothetical protein
VCINPLILEVEMRVTIEAEYEIVVYVQFAESAIPKLKEWIVGLIDEGYDIALLSFKACT